MRRALIVTEVAFTFGVWWIVLDVAADPLRPAPPDPEVELAPIVVTLAEDPFPCSTDPMLRRVYQLRGAECAGEE
jgi:hypothetical protein